MKKVICSAAAMLIMWTACIDSLAAAIDIKPATAAKESKNMDRENYTIDTEGEEETR